MINKLFNNYFLKYKVVLICFIAVATCIMGYYATKVEIAYQYAKLLPNSHQASKDYIFFKSQFGLDGNILLVGIDYHPLKQVHNFKQWQKLHYNIKSIKGIKSVTSLINLIDIYFDTLTQSFKINPIKIPNVLTKKTLNDYLTRLNNLSFYKGLIFNEGQNATIMAVTFDDISVDSRNRIDITNNIKQQTDAFTKSTSIQTHLSGLPFIRSTIAQKITHEMSLFLGISFLISIVLLWFFFKSFQSVFYPILVVLCGVIFTFGSIVLFGFKLSILSGLIPPLIIVIGIPNCIFILNKYHLALTQGLTKINAIQKAFYQSCLSLFLANITTAIGFAVFCFANNQLLFEFGLIASINVMITFLLSITLIPIIFSLLQQAPARHLKHLNSNKIKLILNKITHFVFYKKQRLYIITLVIIIISIIGILKIKSVSYIVDDLPSKDLLLEDLKYFENKYGGVLPFEIVINTNEQNGVFKNNARILYKVHALQKLLQSYPEFSKPMSIVELIKFINQSYHQGASKYYKIPSITDLKNLSQFITQDSTNLGQLKSFIDKNKQLLRISCQMADVGSVKIEALIQQIKPRIDSIFNYNLSENTAIDPKNKIDITLTGNSILYLKGNSFLLNNLIESVFLAIILIALFMFILFTSFSMIIISTLPSLISLTITAGIMGYFGIPLKTSTMLVFSIAFGISSDGTLYFLTKYRNEIRKYNKTVAQAINTTISEIGVSMVYTALILFCGFGVFLFSDFGGTQALGVLIAITLLVAYCANLVLLPALLLTLNFIKTKRL